MGEFGLTVTWITFRV